jgi:hypothetical protein
MGDRLATSSDGNIHAVLVARSGKLVYERYFKGSDEVPAIFFGRRVENVTFDADTLHNVKSVSKSVVSLTVGIALDRGLIRSVDEPILSFFPELEDLRTPEKDRLLLKAILCSSLRPSDLHCARREILLVRCLRYAESIATNASSATLACVRQVGRPKAGSRRTF